MTRPFFRISAAEPAIDPYVVILRMDRGPMLVIEQADAFAYAFFATDASSVGFGAYDSLSGKGVANRVTTDDIVAINTTMRARSPHEAWELLTKAIGDLPWLTAIPLAFDLFGASDAQWKVVRSHAEQAFADTVAPYRNLSVASKVLHLKRPRLFPVLDSFVIQQLGAGGRSAIEVLDHVRQIGRDNADALKVIAANLQGVGLERSRVRILDSLLWSSHPATSLARSLDNWEHVIRFVRPETET